VASVLGKQGFTEEVALYGQSFIREVYRVRLGRRRCNKDAPCVSFPSENISDPANADHIVVFALLDKHIRRGDDES
jgi:hypothetical protein